MMRERLLLIAVLMMMSFVSMGNAVVVTNVTELIDAIDDANSGGDKLIECENGTYPLPDLLHIIADSITVQSLNGERDSVIIQGQGMGGGVSHVFLVQGSDFCLRDLTLGWVANHGIQIQGEQNADRPVVSNIHFVDTYEQMLKTSAGGTEFSDSGLVEYCLFEYSAGIGPQYYIGGIDCHRSRYWIVRNNVFKNIRSPSGSLAEHAIHFWNNSEHTLVESNLILTCDRGIGFGLGSSQHTGGIIRNNMIYHDTTEGFADVGIGLETAPDAEVYNNTIFFENSYPNSIEYRWPATMNVYIANNLTNKAIVARDGATGIDTNNVTNALPSWFVDVGSGDLHLNYEVVSVVDKGIFISGLTEDFDGDARPQGPGYDIGADEYMESGIGEDRDQNYKTQDLRLIAQPNPFGNEVEIYLLGDLERGRKGGGGLKIYDISGRMVREISLLPFSFLLGAKAIWDSRDEGGKLLPPGIYFIKLESGNSSRMLKIVKIK
jgi:hypothetical protein